MQHAELHSLRIELDAIPVTGGTKLGVTSSVHILHVLALLTEVKSSGQRMPRFEACTFAISVGMFQQAHENF